MIITIEVKEDSYDKKNRFLQQAISKHFDKKCKIVKANPSDSVSSVILFEHSCYIFSHKSIRLLYAVLLKHSDKLKMGIQEDEEFKITLELLPGEKVDLADEDGVLKTYYFVKKNDESKESNSNG